MILNGILDIAKEHALGLNQLYIQVKKQTHLASPLLKYTGLCNSVVCSIGDFAI